MAAKKRRWAIPAGVAAYKAGVRFGVEVSRRQSIGLFGADGERLHILRLRIDWKGKSVIRAFILEDCKEVD